MRVSELAKKMKLTSKEVVGLLKKAGVKSATSASSVSEAAAKKILASKKKAAKPAAKTASKTTASKKKTVAKNPKAESKKTKAAKPKAAPKPAAVPQSSKKVTAQQAAPPAPKVQAVPPPVQEAPAASVIEEKPSAPEAKSKEPRQVEKESPPQAAPPLKAEGPPKKPLRIKTPLTVKALAEKLSVSPSEIIKQLMKLKIMATINQLMTDETIEKVLPNYGFSLEKAPSFEEQLQEAHGEEEHPDSLKPRPVIVTLMGHVDHGKTSLLDKIRESKVAAGESGGITQHLGAYQVKLPKGTITFLDTPGHEAFTSMRARGAHVTDVVIIVVAADDGVMPQTEEAIDHAKAAGATIVVAVNKIDMPGADPEKVKQQLTQKELASEDWGGKTIVVPVSAKTGEGIDQLLEMMLLEAELLELKANPDKPAKGYVLEAELSKGRGATAHVLVQNGTLHVGDVLVSGTYYGKIRALLDDHGRRLKDVGPSTPAEVMGLNGVPTAGDPFFVVSSERKARELVGSRQDVLDEARGEPAREVVTLEDFHRQLETGKLKSLNLILKADVGGSVEALRDSLNSLSTDQVSLKFLHTGVGDITGPDVLLAEASSAVVIGFHVDKTPEAEDLAKKGKVDIRTYAIIYEAIADIRAALEGLLEPKRVEQFVGRAKVLQAFKVSKVGAVAGCQVTKGKMLRGAFGRVFRGQEIVHEGKITSLKRFKEDVKEVAEGVQCGVSVAGFSSFEVGDTVEALEVQEVAQKL